MSMMLFDMNIPTSGNVSNYILFLYRDSRQCSAMEILDSIDNPTIGVMRELDGGCFGLPV
jgi:hypothetical protein